MKQVRYSGYLNILLPESENEQMLRVKASFIESKVQINAKKQVSRKRDRDELGYEGRSRQKEIFYLESKLYFKKCDDVLILAETSATVNQYLQDFFEKSLGKYANSESEMKEIDFLLIVQKSKTPKERRQSRLVLCQKQEQQQMENSNMEQFSTVKKISSQYDWSLQKESSCQKCFCRIIEQMKSAFKVELEQARNKMDFITEKFEVLNRQHIQLRRNNQEMKQEIHDIKQCQQEMKRQYEMMKKQMEGIQKAENKRVLTLKKVEEDFIKRKNEDLVKLTHQLSEYLASLLQEDKKVSMKNAIFSENIKNKGTFQELEIYQYQEIAIQPKDQSFAEEPVPFIQMSESTDRKHEEFQFECLFKNLDEIMKKISQIRQIWMCKEQDRQKEFSFHVSNFGDWKNCEQECVEVVSQHRSERNGRELIQKELESAKKQITRLKNGFKKKIEELSNENLYLQKQLSHCHGELSRVYEKLYQKQKISNSSNNQSVMDIGQKQWKLYNQQMRMQV